MLFLTFQPSPRNSRASRAGGDGVRHRDDEIAAEIPRQKQRRDHDDFVHGKFWKTKINYSFQKYFDQVLVFFKIS